MGERKRRGMAKDIWIGDVQNGDYDGQEVELKGLGKTNSWLQ